MSQAGIVGVGGTSPEIETITGNVGGAVGPDGAFNLFLVGVGPVTVTGNPGTNTLSISVSGSGTTWTREVNAAVPMVSDHGYINTNAGLTTFTLPAVAAVGTIIEVAGEGAGGWTIAQNAGQNIQFDVDSTTPGVGGTLSSAARYNCVRLVCRVANTTFQVLSNIGILNVV